MTDPPYSFVASDVKLHAGVRMVGFVNLYGCEIGADTWVGPFVEIQKGVRVGARCKVQSHTFICEGVTIEDEVFVGHGVVFTNDRKPRATSPNGDLLTDDEWTLETTIVRRRASIGSGAVILPGLSIGEEAVIGAGAVVTKNVPDRTIVKGSPARPFGELVDW